MKTFTDSKNYTWEICINLGIVKYIDDSLGVNLLDADSITYKGYDKLPSGLSLRLCIDDLFLTSIVWEIVKGQSDRNECKDETEFYSRIDGAAMKRMSEAFFEEYQSFFMDRGVEVFAKTLELKNKALETYYQKSLEALTGNDVGTDVETALKIAQTVQNQ